MPIHKKPAKKVPGKKVAKLLEVKLVEIPPEIPVHAAVTIVATDPEKAETLSHHVAEWLHKAGTGFAAFFHEDN